jgi:CHC2 zinc finger
LAILTLKRRFRGLVFRQGKGLQHVTRARKKASAYRGVMSTENVELRAKIDEARRLLPMPSLLRRLGYDEKHIGKTALCPFHSDEHPSFSVFEGEAGWQHKCFVGCSSGDEIAFLAKHFRISRREAINRYLEMADFPAQCPKSREYPELPKSLASPKSLSLPESPCVQRTRHREGA